MIGFPKNKLFGGAAVVFEIVGDIQQNVKKLVCSSGDWKRLIDDDASYVYRIDLDKVDLMRIPTTGNIVPEGWTVLFISSTERFLVRWKQTDSPARTMI